MTARCLHGSGCTWILDATNDLEAGSVAIMSHTAGTGHGIFTRRLEDVACVVLNNAQEQARRVTVNRLEVAANPEAADEHARAEA
ncbi:hypothetical protein [Streptomyces sp. NBC_00648]|uniref:hypothetical protein n=1 Tax=Streptomyces sp. NBC_00648 TaxID=2975797 RepID=UPI003251F804